MPEQFYRIAWKSKFTEASGYGTGAWPKKQAQALCDDINNDPIENAYCNHWIEPIPEES